MRLQTICISKFTLRRSPSLSIVAVLRYLRVEIKINFQTRLIYNILNLKSLYSNNYTKNYSTLQFFPLYQYSIYIILPPSYVLLFVLP